MIRGVFDAIAQERDGRILVVDYKTDRIADADPEAVVTESYATQRVIYALAALRTGARQVEVLHAFLERPEDPVAARFEAADTVALEAELGKLAGNLLDDEFRVTQSPHRSVCHGCPAEGGLCSWPLSATRRTAPDRLF